MSTIIQPIPDQAGPDIQKYSIGGFILLLFSCLSSNLLASSQPANCSIGNNSSFDAIVLRVIDGDTLVIKKIAQHTKKIANKTIYVRLIGINSPEKKNTQFPAQPYARSARLALKRLIQQGQNKVTIISSNKDKYGRLLAHVFTRTGINIQHQLLTQGLAFNLAWPPHLKYQHCYRLAETTALNARLKIWKHRYYRPVAISDLGKTPLPAPDLNRNFHRITGKVMSIGRSRNSRWINFKANTISVRIAKTDLKYFEIQLNQLIGQNIIITGYIIPYRSRRPSAKPLFIRLRHSQQIRTLTEND